MKQPPQQRQGPHGKDLFAQFESYTSPGKYSAECSHHIAPPDNSDIKLS